MFLLLGGLLYTVLMYRALAIAVLLAAAAFPPSLEAQMRTMQHPGGTARISIGSRFPVVQPPPPGRFGVMSPRPFDRRASFVGPAAFRHNLRFNIFSGNSCFTGPFFDPFFCQQFFFRNPFLFAQPVLPYPYFRSDYGYGSEVAAQPQVVAVPAAAPVQAPPAAPLEPLLIEWQGDHFVRMALSQKVSASGQGGPDYSEKTAPRSAALGQDCSSTAAPASACRSCIPRRPEGRGEQLHDREWYHLLEGRLLDQRILDPENPDWRSRCTCHAEAQPGARCEVCAAGRSQ